MVDTSVWINYFNNRPSIQAQVLDEIIKAQGNILAGDLILTELLQGIRFKREYAQIEAAFKALPLHEMVGERIARQSAEYVRQLRDYGITVRKTIDCLIATWCIEHNVPLLHVDRDFKYFAQFGLIEVESNQGEDSHEVRKR